MKSKTKKVKKHMITRVTKTEFETADGAVHPIPFELDHVPTVEEFQKIYDEWLGVFQEKGLIKKESNE